MPDVVILCGGKGTRAYPDTLELPKPLLPVAGRPIVEHVMRIFAAQGHRRFILAAGYLGELLEQRYLEPPGDIGFDVEIEVVDTGQDTETGERLRLAADHTRGPRFFATYADGLADVDVNTLLAAHIDSGALATVTTVPLPSQYGVLESDDEDRIVRFREKPRLEAHWINGGFFVFEQDAFDFWEGDVLERDALPALARVGGLHAYRHAGFWKSMDTFKDRQDLESLAADGEPPWRVAAQVDGTRSAFVLAGGQGTASPDTARRDVPGAAAAGGAPSLSGRRVRSLPESEASETGNGNGTGNGTGRSRGHAGHARGNGHGNGHDNGNGHGHRGGIATESKPAVDPGDPLSVEDLDAVAPDRRVARRRLGIVTVLTMVIDALAVVAAYAAVASIETEPFASRLVGSGRSDLLWTVPVWLAAFAVHGLYQRTRLVAASEEARRLLQGVITGAAGTVMFTFVISNDVGRSWVAVVSVAILLLVGLCRLLVRGAVRLLTTRGVIGTRVLVVGTNHEALTIARTLERQRWLGYSPVGVVSTHRGQATAAALLPVLGDLSELSTIVEEHSVGAVVVAGTAVDSTDLSDLCSDLAQHDVDIRISPALPYVSASRLSVEPLDGLATLAVRSSRQLAPRQRVAKRAVDLVGGALALLVALPVIAVLALAVRITSRGPAFFRQLRVGEGGKPFVLYKLRTMVSDAEDRVVDLRDRNEADGLLFKVTDDPRVTRLGRFLRRWALDELPQLWNVVRGEMSLVGPRPPLPNEAARYDQWLRGRLRVRPGLTGLWQVNGGHELRFDDYVRYDLFYVENWSISLDLFVLARTVPALLFRKGIT